MKKRDVKIGSVYAVKVSGQIAPVRLDSVAFRSGRGWLGTNLRTKRQIRILTAGKLRCELERTDAGTWRPLS